MAKEKKEVTSLHEYIIESAAKKGKTPADWFDAMVMQMNGCHLASHIGKFTNPDISTNYDFNPDQARETRKTILKRVSKEEIIVGGAHLPFPGVGHIVENENGNGYRWIPLQYKPVEN